MSSCRTSAAPVRTGAAGLPRGWVGEGRRPAIEQSGKRLHEQLRAGAAGQRDADALDFAIEHRGRAASRAGLERNPRPSQRGDVERAASAAGSAATGRPGPGRVPGRGLPRRWPFASASGSTARDHLDLIVDRSAGGRAGTISLGRPPGAVEPRRRSAAGAAPRHRDFADETGA